MNKKTTILAVDDTHETLQLLARILEKEGYTVIPAKSGELALASLEKRAVDLILLDVLMPGIDGLEVCRRIKANKKINHIPIIFLSALADKSERVEGLRLGGADYITKPFEKEELLARVNTHLSLSVLNKTQRELTENLQIKNEEYTAINEEIRTTNEELLKTLENLKESENQFTLLVENAPQPIFIQTDNKFAYLNKAALTLYGAESVDQLAGSFVIERIHPDSRDLVKQRIKNLNENKITAEKIEYKHLKLDNSEIFVEVNAVPFRFNKQDGALVFVSDITNRKQAEKDLLESEMRFRSVFENSPIGKSMTNIDGTIKTNKAFSDMLGYTFEELQNKNWKEITHPDDIEESEKVIKLLLGGSISNCKYEKRYIHKDGTIRHTEIRTALNKNEKNEPLFFITTIIDVTKRKHTEAQLNESLALLQRMNENSPLGMHFYKLDSTNRLIFTGANPAADVILQVDNSQFIGKTIEEAFPPLTQTEVPGRYRDAAAKGILWSTEQIAYNDKRIVGAFEVKAFQTTPNNMVAIFMDITSRKQAEILLQEKSEEIESQNEELQQLNEELAQTNEELSAELEKAEKSEKEIAEILANFNKSQSIAKIGSWEWDIASGKVWWSDELYRIFEVNPKTFVPTVESNAKFVHPEDNEPYHKAVFKTFETGEPLDYVIRLIAASGKLKYCRSLANVFFNEKKEAFKMLGTFGDITDQVEISNELKVAKEKAEESERLKSAFLANMSHEIRTPMNGILGFTELLKEPSLTGEEQQSYIKVIENSGNRMLNIINNIINISKIESGMMEVSLSPTNINEQTEYIYMFFKTEAEKKGLHLMIRNGLPDMEASINTDREKVYAILTNLIKNAIKFTGKGTIEFGYYPKRKASGPTELEFYVRDEGIGIPEGQKKVIFERFRKGNESKTRNYEGAGLGLAITKAYVEMLDGKIWVESEEGLGSTFYFTLPYHTLPEEVTDFEISGMVNDPEKWIKKPNILIVEDDKPSETLLKIGLKKYGNVIGSVDSGSEAIEICRNRRDIDLVMMDIQIPEMDGLEATRQIRKFNNEVIIIAQTAYGFSSDREKALSAGCNDYISKPIDQKKLLGIIKKYFSIQ